MLLCPHALFVVQGGKRHTSFIGAQDASDRNAGYIAGGGLNQISEATLGSRIRFRGASSLRGRDRRVVGVFGVVDLACDLGTQGLCSLFPGTGRGRPRSIVDPRTEIPSTKGVL